MDIEKKQIISDMIALAKADNELHEREYDFILAVAGRLGLSKEDVDHIHANPSKVNVLTTEMQRITQFHRLLLLMNVDQETHIAEMDALRNYGLKLGIRPEAIEQILNEMEAHENNMIPSTRLIEIFKRFYN
ncbi:TerB family tellurite resistance protein [Dokdonia sp.]|uniref:TerB family tellurite resistance protein n=1 Tax=Dokdonia sp. TaxID=2024995 RepID=UPI003267D2C8